jgi:hypothetical protein
VAGAASVSDLKILYDGCLTVHKPAANRANISEEGLQAGD